MSQLGTITKEIGHLGGRVARARAAVTRGEAADLREVEPQVAALCQEIQAFKGKDAQALRAGLVALLEELDELRKALQQGPTDLKSEIGESSERRRAMQAYNRQR